jgi:hypothetical protein
MGIAPVVALPKSVKHALDPMAFRRLQLEKHATAELSISASDVSGAVQAAAWAEG